VWCERAIETAETSGNLGAEALARRIFDWALFELGLPVEHVHSLRSLALYEELDDLRGQAKVLSNLGVGAYWAGRWNEAVDYWERSSDVVQRTGDEVTMAFTTVNIAEIKLDQGRPEEARALLEGAERVLHAAGDRTGTALAEIDLGRAAYQGRRYEEATALLEHARDELRAIGHQRLAFEASARLAECRLLSGDARAALAAADELLLHGEMGTGGGSPLLHRVRGVALHCLDDDDGATAALERSLDVARSRNVAFDAALALRALADVDLRRRAELLAESRELLDRLGGRILPTALGPLTEGAFREPSVS
jgi:tetratricopeptide (TPR) repeat protein